MLDRSKETEVVVKKYRIRIPDRPNANLNLWSIMKNCIGKELTKIPMPVSVMAHKNFLYFFLYLRSLKEKKVSFRFFVSKWNSQARWQNVQERGERCSKEAGI